MKGYVKLCIYYGVIILIIVSQTACKKFLEKKPDETLTTPTTLKSLQALLDDGLFMNFSSPSLGEASADDYYLPMERYQAISVPLVKEAYTWNISGRSDYNYSGGNDWSNLYLVVYNANLCLEQIDKINSNDQNISTWNNIKGSAHFFRARSFMYLAWIYAKSFDSVSSQQDLGIPLRLSSDFNIPSNRSSVSQTYSQIIDDFKNSINYLPDFPIHPFRPSKAASYGFLARTYLSMRAYDSAYKFAGLALQIKSDLMDYNDNPLIDQKSLFPFAEFNSEVIHHYMDNIMPIFTILYRNARIDSNLVNSYHENDLRKKAFFDSLPNGYQFRGSYSGDALYAPFTGIATDELFLIRAECSARRGNTSDAMQDLNNLLVKRWKGGTFIPFNADNPTIALELILNERRKELVMRDLRWSDIKRLNKEGFNIALTRIVNGETFTLSPNSNKFALPIPTDIINQTGMPQNPL